MITIKVGEKGEHLIRKGQIHVKSEDVVESIMVITCNTIHHVIHRRNSNAIHRDEGIRKHTIF